MKDLAWQASQASELLDELRGLRCLTRLAHITAAGADAVRYLDELPADPADSEQIRRIRQNWQEIVKSKPSDGDEWLREVAALRWDMRLGKDRLTIPTAREILPPTWRAEVAACSEELRLVQDSSAHGHFDVVVILGGQVRANQIRTHYAAQLLRDRQITTSHVIALAGVRMIDEQEQIVAQAIGTSGIHERLSLAEGMAAAFGVERQDFRRRIPADGPSRQEVELLFADAPLELKILTAPAITGKVPSARECLEWLFTSSVDLPFPLKRILCVTTPIYRIQNEIDLLLALSMAGSDAQAVTAASFTASSEAIANNPQPLLGQHYLQEMKAVIDSMDRLEPIVRSHTLPTSSTARVVNQAQVHDPARVRGNAAVGGHAKVREHAYVGGQAQVAGTAEVFGKARVSEAAEVEAESQVFGNARILGRSRIVGTAEVSGEAHVSGRAWIRGNTVVTGAAKVLGDAMLGDPTQPGKVEVRDATVTGHTDITGFVTVSGQAEIYGSKGLQGERLRVQCPQGELTISGNARIYGSVHICARGRITDSAFITGEAYIGGECDITRPHHVQTLTIEIDREPTIITVFRSAPGESRVFLGSREVHSEEVPRKYFANVQNLRYMVAPESDGHTEH